MRTFTSADRLQVLMAYIQCAEFTENDTIKSEGFEFTQSDMLEAMKAVDFLLDDARAIKAIKSLDLTMSDVGHDLWLTRNGHGAGFWDRGHGKRGDVLTTVCEELGAHDLECVE